jgi:hypothetical protein
MSAQRRANDKANKIDASCETPKKRLGVKTRARDSSKLNSILFHNNPRVDKRRGGIWGILKNICSFSR